MSGRPRAFLRWVTASMRKPSTPLSSHPSDGLSHLRIFPVEVGLMWREQVQVVLAGDSIEGPGRAAEDAFPVIGWSTLPPVSPDVPVPPGIRPGGSGFDEPGVLIAGVVGHQIEDQAHAPAMHP